MGELTDDLGLLLADTDVDSRANILAGHMTPGPFSVASKSPPIGATTTVTRLPSFRNMTWLCHASNTQLWTRFIGHHTINGNREGIASLSHPEFVSELERLLAVEPDVIIVNSGLHDANTAFDMFESTVTHLADRLRETAATVIWKGSGWMHDRPAPQLNLPDNEKLQKLDAIAKRAFEARGMLFVNISNVVQQIYCSPQMQTSELPLIGDLMHHGSDLWFTNRGSGFSSLIQTYITQAILNSLCIK